MKIKPLIIAALLTSSIFGTQVFAKELAVCFISDIVPDLFDKIICKDTTKPLKKENEKSDSYETTLYQLYKQGWKIVATQDAIYTEKTSYVRIYLEK